MARVFGMFSGVEIELPHPDVPCVWCGNSEMDTEACPSAKDICSTCCYKVAWGGCCEAPYDPPPTGFVIADDDWEED